MARIVSLTLNPTIDNSCEADECARRRRRARSTSGFQPGGGGSTSRGCSSGFDDDVHAIFLGGGATGQVLDDLLDRAGVSHCRIAIADDTRSTLTVFERSTGQEYRFVPEGPKSAVRMERCLDLIVGLECDYFIASGSLPRGVPDDFYARAGTSWEAAPVSSSTRPGRRQGQPGRGGMFLVKPSPASWRN